MRRPSALIVCLSLALASCGGGTSFSPNLRVKIEADGSGTAHASSLVDRPTGGPVTGASENVDWKDRARAVFDSGEFPNVNDVDIAGISFKSGKTPDGMSYLRIEVPRGEEATWPAIFTVPDDGRRGDLARVISPGRGTSELGRKFRMTIELPSPIVSQGFQPPIEGVTSTHEKSTASLTTTLDAAAAGTEPIIWHVTW